MLVQDVQAARKMIRRGRAPETVAEVLGVSLDVLVECLELFEDALITRTARASKIGIAHTPRPDNELVDAWLATHEVTRCPPASAYGAAAYDRHDEGYELQSHCCVDQGVVPEVDNRGSGTKPQRRAR